MDINLKCPAWGRNCLVILIGAGLLIGISPFFEPGETAKAYPAIADFEETPDGLDEGLILLQENSLLPISNPSNSGNQVIGQIMVVVTAYSSTPWETDGNPYLTAAGTWVRDGIVANNYLPIGTKIRIPELYGDKIFVVEDRMNWKKGNYHIDIWFSTYWEAKNFGAKSTYIEILEG